MSDPRRSSGIRPLTVLSACAALALGAGAASAATLSLGGLAQVSLGGADGQPTTLGLTLGPLAADARLGVATTSGLGVDLGLGANLTGPLPVDLDADAGVTIGPGGIGADVDVDGSAPVVGPVRVDTGVTVPTPTVSVPPVIPPVVPTNPPPATNPPGGGTATPPPVQQQNPAPDRGAPVVERAPADAPSATPSPADGPGLIAPPVDRTPVRSARGSRDGVELGSGESRSQEPAPAAAARRSDGGAPVAGGASGVSATSGAEAGSGPAAVARPQAVTPPPPRSVMRRAAATVEDAASSPWFPLALFAAAVLYLFGQRGLDLGAKMSHAGRGGPADDEVFEV